MKKKAPKFQTDKEAQKFLDQDLTDYIDPRKTQRVTFEFLPKTEAINLRFPPELINGGSKKIRQRGHFLSKIYPSGRGRTFGLKIVMNQSGYLKGSGVFSE